MNNNNNNLDSVKYDLIDFKENNKKKVYKSLYKTLYNKYNKANANYNKLANLNILFTIYTAKDYKNK